MSNFKQHLVQLAILTALLAVSLFLFINYNHNQIVQFWISATTVGGYIVWGIIHHYAEKRLTWEVLSEYLLLGCFVILAFKLVLQV